MQVSLTATGGLERRLEVAVPAQQVTSEVEQRLKRLSRTARLKGFRPGKAPIAIVRQQFGEQVHAEVVSDLLRSSFAEAVTQEHLKPAAGPRIEPIALQPGADLKYAAVFEILPEVTVKPFGTIAVERPSASVTDADLEAMIESMRRQHPKFAPVQRPAQTTDRVTIDYDGRVDGAAFEGSEGRDVNFIVGAGRVLSQLETAVVGASSGETRTANVAYPAGHASTALAGRTAEFTLTVKQIEEQTLPEVDEEFCRAFAVEEGGVEALRAEVRKSMERELEGVIRNRVRAQILDGLYRDNPLDVPRAMVEESIQRLQADMAQRIGARDAAQLPARESFEEPARRRVALGMVMAEIARAEDLKPDRARVLSRVDELAAQYPNSEEVRRAYLQNSEAMRQIESAVLEDEVVERVLAQAQVTERPMSFRDLTGFGENTNQESST
jgi:trigger factor